MTNGKRRNSELEALHLRVRLRRSERPKILQLTPPEPPPRYDAVYIAGTVLLDQD
jgi:hypothetical protein